MTILLGKNMLPYSSGEVCISIRVKYIIIMKLLLFLNQSVLIQRMYSKG